MAARSVACDYGYYGQLKTASTERRRFPALARTSRERDDNGSPRIRRIQNDESARDTTLAVAATSTTRVQLNYCCACTTLNTLLRVNGGTRVGLNKKIENKFKRSSVKYILLLRGGDNSDDETDKTRKSPETTAAVVAAAADSFARYGCRVAVVGGCGLCERTLRRFPSPTHE